MNEKIEIKVDGSQATPENPLTLVVREGKAAEIPVPAKLAYSGRLDTPKQFLSGKMTSYDKLSCTLVVDTDNGTILFFGQEKNRESSDNVSGALVTSEILKEFCINETRRWTVKELIELFKRNRAYFATKEQQAALLANLRNWNVGVTKLYEEVKNDTTGDAKKGIETRVEGINLPAFTLMVPLFKGYQPEAVEVEFGVDASGSGVTLFMDSPDLLERTLIRKKELIEEQIAWFAEAFGCSIVYKS